MFVHQTDIEILLFVDFVGLGLSAFALI